MENLALYENGQTFLYKINPFMILISKNNFKLGIVVQIMLNKILVILVLLTFTVNMGSNLFKLSGLKMDNVLVF